MGKGWAGGPKDKFSSVLTLTVIIMLLRLVTFAGSLCLHQSQGECPRDGRLAPRGSRAPRYKAGLPCRQRAGAPSPTGKALCQEWVMLVPKKNPKSKNQTPNMGTDPQSPSERPGQISGGLWHREGSMEPASPARWGLWSITGKGLVLSQRVTHLLRPWGSQFDWEGGLELVQGPWCTT